MVGMTRSLVIGVLAAASVVAAAAPAAAQSKREMQMMADIRMLQEQTQQLQQQLATALAQLSETLKQLSARQDDQTAATRKGFADQKLTVDQIGSDLRVVKERVDESNVRITSLSQEVEALRVAIPSYPPPTLATDPTLDPSAARARLGHDIPRRCRQLRRRGRCAAGRAATGRPDQPRDLAAAALRHGVDRLHRGPMDAVHRGVQHLSAQLSPQRGRRRRPVLHRRVQLRRRQIHRGDGRLQSRDSQLPARRQGAGRLLQAWA